MPKHQYIGTALHLDFYVHRSKSGDWRYKGKDRAGRTAYTYIVHDVKDEQ